LGLDGATDKDKIEQHQVGVGASISTLSFDVCAEAAFAGKVNQSSGSVLATRCGGAAASVVRRVRRERTTIIDVPITLGCRPIHVYVA
jgi:hypothetical protein